MVAIINNEPEHSAIGTEVIPAGKILASMKDVSLVIEAILPSIGFLSLPREIRDIIYKLIFLKSTPIYPSRERARVSPYTGLLYANRQVYGEAVSILYGENIFQIRGDPRFTAPEFLNLVGCQRRAGWVATRPLGVINEVCLARHHLKRLYIPSHGINIDRLKHLFSLLKYLLNLEYLQVIFLTSLGASDMEVVNVCRLFRDRRPLFASEKNGGFVLRKRISYSMAEDISWMLEERPYKNWRHIVDDPYRRHVWQNEGGAERLAEVGRAPQNIPE